MCSPLYDVLESYESGVSWVGKLHELAESQKGICSSE